MHQGVFSSSFTQLGGNISSRHNQRKHVPHQRNMLRLRNFDVRQKFANVVYKFARLLLLIVNFVILLISYFLLLLVDLYSF